MQGQDFVGHDPERQCKVVLEGGAAFPRVGKAHEGRPQLRWNGCSSFRLFDAPSGARSLPPAQKLRRALSDVLRMLPFADGARRVRT